MTQWEELQVMAVQEELVAALVAEVVKHIWDTQVDLGNLVIQEVQAVAVADKADIQLI